VEKRRDWERAALVDAFARLAPEQGMAALDVPRLTRQAGLPPEAFRENFSSLAACLLVAHDAFFQRLAAHVRGDCAADERPWAERSAAALRAALQFLDETGTRARFFVVDALFVGPAVLERRRAQIEALAEMLREGRDHYPGAALLPDSTECMLVAGTLARITGHLLAEAAEPLGELSADLTELLLMHYLGAEGARAVARSVN